MSSTIDFKCYVCKKLPENFLLSCWTIRRLSGLKQTVSSKHKTKDTKDKNTNLLTCSKFFLTSRTSFFLYSESVVTGKMPSPSSIFPTTTLPNPHMQIRNHILLPTPSLIPLDLKTRSDTSLSRKFRMIDFPSVYDGRAEDLPDLY